MKKIFYILFVVLLTLSASVSARKKAQTIGDVPIADTILVPRDTLFLDAFYRAMNAFALEHYDTAYAYFQKCDLMQPGDAAVQEHLGLLYYASGDPAMRIDNQETTAARYYLREAWKNDTQHYWRGYLNYLYRSKQSEDADEAITVLEKTIADHPTLVDAMEILMERYSDLGRYKEALALQDRIDKEIGYSKQSAANRYELYRSMGKQKKAIQAIDDYLREDPDDYMFQVFRGDLYLAEGKLSSAKAAYDQQARLYPDNPYIHLSYAKYYEVIKDTAMMVKSIARALGSEELDFERKVQIIRQNADLLERTPEGMPKYLNDLCRAYPGEERAYYLLAQYYNHRGWVHAARLALMPILDIAPENNEHWKMQFELMSKDEATTPEEENAFIARAYAAQPNEPQWCYYMAYVYLRENQMDSAMMVIDQGIALGSEKEPMTYVSLHLLKGDLYMQKEDYPAMFAAYDVVLQYDPGNVYVLNNYAYSLAQTGGDLRRAEKMSQKTIEKEPDNAVYLDTYAWILHLAGQDMLARFYMQRAMDHLQGEPNPEYIEHYNTIFGK